MELSHAAGLSSVGATMLWVKAFLLLLAKQSSAAFFCCAEGQLLSCSYDYLTEDWNAKSFVLYAYVFNYVVPVSTCIFFYSQIVMAVVKHERALKEQAKKMNVDSLRQGDAVSNSKRVVPNSFLENKANK